MKKLSSFLTLILTLSSLVLCSCSDDDNPNPLSPSNGVLDISTTEMSFDIKGGEKTFTVNGGTAYVRSEADWLTVARVSGDSKSSVFSVTCAENKAEEERVGTVLANLNGAFERITVTQAGKVTPPDVEHNFRQASAIAKDMYPGWNLGNTMEGNINGENFTNNVGLGGETAWQGTKTTQEIIDFVKAQGFKSVRIPCNWVCGHITNANTNTIDPEWMARVREIVDYCINAGLYVVLNDHYDGGWVEKSFADVSDANIQKNSQIMKDIWTQIANEFKNYDEHLLFAGLNEPDATNQAQTDALVKYEQAFIDAVRATGSNNEKRILIVQGPGTDIDRTAQYYKTMPTDIAEGRLMMEVHYYTPPQFTGVWENGNPFYFWGSDNQATDDTYKKFNSTSGEDAMLKLFQKMKTNFADKGIPVILGEYGANWRNLGNEDAQNKHDASIKQFNKCVVLYAIECGIVPFVWDINVANQNGTDGIMTVINRGKQSIFCTPAMEGIKEGVAAGK